MLFNSIEYLIFLPVVLVLYFLLGSNKLRIILLLIASYFFYMCWNPVFIILILVSTVVDYTISRRIDASKVHKHRKRLLYLSLLTNLGILFYFKYYNFLLETLQPLVDLMAPEMVFRQHTWLLPVGISFYTFQTLGYTLDVYNKKLKAEKNFFTFALYVSFFPQLVAGPIERSTQLLPQFAQTHTFEYQRFSDGFKLILWGLFKKMVVADRLAVYVDLIYNNPDSYTGIPVLIASIFFVFQIYCDFSAYSDIAIGSARILGYNLMDNFKGPLLSHNVTELWRRWHISLSTWIRDYIYNPMLFKHREGGMKSIILILVATFVAVGIWHGANWTYILFGFLHGIVIAIEAITRKKRKKIFKNLPQHLIYPIAVLLTFVFWTITCLIFRSSSVEVAGNLFHNLFAHSNTTFQINIFQKVSEFTEFKITLGFLLILILAHFIEYGNGIVHFLTTKHIVIRWSIYMFLINSIILFSPNNKEEFIYFQF